MDLKTSFTSWCIHNYFSICSIFPLLLNNLIACCKSKEDCGWNSSCVNSTCSCPDDYKLCNNNRDCAHRNCSSIADCLECLDTDTCTRCAYFIEESTHKCLTTCTGEAKVVHNGSIEGTVCTASNSKSNNLEIIIGVVVGVCSGLVLFVIFVIAFCCHMKRKRGNVNLQQRCYQEGMLAGKIKQVSLFDNNGFESEDDLYNSVVDKDAYLLELDKLRPHASTLLIILNSIRRKVRAMDPSDARIPTYKGVIHQLCRVLVLMHKKDPVLSVPSDAMGLLEWATQMLEDHRMETQENLYFGGVTQSSTNKISYIDVPVQQQQQRPAPSQNCYATPKIQHNPQSPRFLHTFTPSQLSSQSFLSDAGYYSSVPVPVDIGPSSPKFKSVQSSSQPNTLTQSYEIPWDVKLKADSLNTLNCSGSDVTMGYFANGRYYDPAPRNLRHLQQHKPKHKSEIYAPASSYSDRSNTRFSTFVKETSVDISLSLSGSSDTSGEEEDGEDYMKNENEDEFPFDPKDLTEPVDV
ncbi:hypothetical protein ACJMK2_033879 [Sinanodonta woodiana]|uniref:Uncharacterized protein n=1 Tax=Sinanodonta woodiana TaxID=1069815 RepID=A0ABD3WR98_SINWO